MLNYLERGPCCDYYDRMRQRFQGQIKTLHKLVGGNPRHFLSLYKMWKREGISLEEIVFALNKECACHRTPNPFLTRRVIARLLENREEPQLFNVLGAIRSLSG